MKNHVVENNTSQDNAFFYIAGYTSSGAPYGVIWEEIGLEPWQDLEEELLASCYFNSMKLALENGIRKIAFPSISTGVYAFPVELAAKVAVKTVNRFLQSNPNSFDLVEWVLFDAHTEAVYEDEVDKLY